MPQDSILFGSIAVALGRVTPEQVAECLRIQEQWAALGVRKLIGQVLREKGYLDEKGIREVLRAQGYKEKRLESKDYARIAMECGFATHEQLTACLAEQKDAYRQGQGMRSLGRFLLDKGYLDAHQHESVMRAVNRVHGRTQTHFGRTSVLYGVKECGVCFEMIDFRADHCDRCGAFFGEVTIKPVCPACKEVQEAGGEYCAKCGANMITGRRGEGPKPVQCHACGGLLAPDQEQCYHCGERRLPSLGERVLVWSRRRGAQIAGDALGRVVLAASLATLVVALIYAKEIAGTIRATVVGPDRARLEAAFERLRMALFYGDGEGVRACLAQGPGGESRETLFRRIVEAPEAMTELEILAVELDDASVAGDAATTYATVQARYKTSGAGGGQGIDELWTAVQTGGLDTVSGGRKLVKRRLTWRWRRAGDRWLMQEK